MDEKPQYAIAGRYAEFMEWRKRHTGLHVSYLTRERAKFMLAKGAPRGVLHRIGTWETSPARRAAERLEG